MAKIDIWMPVYIGDYLRDTTELSAEEHGAYLLLLMHYWQKKGEIGCDIDRLSRVARTNEETARFILGYFFTLVDGNYKNKRADQEIGNADNRRDSARENGLKGGRPPINNPHKTGGLTGGFDLANRAGNPQKSSSSSSSPIYSEEEIKKKEIPFSRNFNPSNISTRIQSAIEVWNNYGAKPPYRKSVLNIPPDKMREIAASFASYSDDEINESIANYLKIIASSEYDAFPLYGTFLGFAASGIEQYCQDAGPFERCKKKSNGSGVVSIEDQHAQIDRIAKELELERKQHG